MKMFIAVGREVMRGFIRVTSDEFYHKEDLEEYINKSIKEKENDPFYKSYWDNYKILQIEVDE